MIRSSVLVTILFFCFQSAFCFHIGGIKMARVAGDTLDLHSSSFRYGDRIPGRYTIDGGNIFPALAWKAGPRGTKSFVVMCVNPDKPNGDIVLWIVFNIPPTQTFLPEGFINPNHSYGDRIATVRDGIKQIGYEGIFLPKNFPIPQEYFFIVFALDSMLDFKNEREMTKDEVFEAIKGRERAAGILKVGYTKDPEVTPLFRS